MTRFPVPDYRKPQYRIPSYVTETLYVLEAEIARGEDIMAAMLRTINEGN